MMMNHCSSRRVENIRSSVWVFLVLLTGVLSCVVVFIESASVFDLSSSPFIDGLRLPL